MKKAVQQFTWDDYLTWTDDERWEIIDGVTYNMTPAHSVRYQNITGKLYSQLEQN